LTFSNVESGEVFELATLDGTGSVVVTPFGDDDGDGLLAQTIPPTTAAGIANSASSYFWFFESMSADFLAAHVGMRADSPVLTDLNGTPLLLRYRETDFDFVLQLARTFTNGEMLSLTDGTIASWPGPIVHAMPTSFSPDELFTLDPLRFPLYTGDAIVSDVAYVGVAPEPTSAALLTAIGLVAFVRRRR
jgi:MprA protease rhombosortase-interaction domain-containing protein